MRLNDTRAPIWEVNLKATPLRTILAKQVPENISVPGRPLHYSLNMHYKLSKKAARKKFIGKQVAEFKKLNVDLTEEEMRAKAAEMFRLKYRAFTCEQYLAKKCRRRELQLQRVDRATILQKLVMEW